MAETNNNFYELLRVSQSAPTEVIQAAYKTLMSKMKMHPDLGGDETQAASLNEAYQTLKDASLREKYDIQLKNKEPEKTQRQEGKERRRAPRKDVDATISFCLSQDNRWYTARVKDLSTIGLKLIAHEPIGKGQQVVIACPNPASHALRGVVRWSRMYHPSTFERVYEAGVEFEVVVEDVDKRFSF